MSFISKVIKSSAIVKPSWGERLKRRWLILFLLILACTLFAYVDALGIYAANGRREWWYTIYWSLTSWYTYILIVPAAVKIGRRFRIDRHNLLRTSLVHVPAGLLFAITHFILLVLIGQVFVFGTQYLSSFFSTASFILISDLLFGIVVYSMILALTHALDYYKQYRDGELKSSQLEAQLAHSQLQALKMQLHPHFLFNTLNSISALQLEDTAAAQRMTARLGDFLRLTLDNVGSQGVTLKQEMEFLTCYLDIERVRFGRRLTVEMKIAPETLDVEVPNLILQPIVENAIKHGISSQIAPGRIEIASTISDHRLRIEVSDNGPGLPDDGAEGREGLGLTNVRARLERFYGSDHRFDLVSASGGGLSVILEIPLIKNASTVPAGVRE